MNTFARVGSAIYNEVNRPVAYVKSNGFESFLKKRLFPLNKYDLLKEPPVDTDGADSVPRDPGEPRYEFRSQESGWTFYLAPRYLRTLSSKSIVWCAPATLKRYQEFDAEVPVYVLLGAGPQSAAPQQVFLFPVKDIRFYTLLIAYLEKYKISTTRAVEEKDLLR